MIMKALLYDNLPKHKLQNKLYSSQISPIWSERLNQIRDSISSSSLLIRIRWYYQPNWTKCVVGKAYGFSSICISERKKCSRLGWRFIFYFLILSNSKIEKTKRIFADHWNKEHSEIKNRNKVKINTNFTIKKAILDDRQL